MGKSKRDENNVRTQRRARPLSLRQRRVLHVQAVRSREDATRKTSPALRLFFLSPPGQLLHQPRLLLTAVIGRCRRRDSPFSLLRHRPPLLCRRSAHVSRPRWPLSSSGFGFGQPPSLSGAIVSLVSASRCSPQTRSDRCGASRERDLLDQARAARRSCGRAAGNRCPARLEVRPFVASRNPCTRRLAHALDLLCDNPRTRQTLPEHLDKTSPAEPRNPHCRSSARSDPRARSRFERSWEARGLRLGCRASLLAPRAFSLLPPSSACGGGGAPRAATRRARARCRVGNRRGLSFVSDQPLDSSNG